VQEFDAFGGEQLPVKLTPVRLPLGRLRLPTRRGPTRIDADHKQTRLESS
jgi:hypothetical protein